MVLYPSWQGDSSWDAGWDADAVWNQSDDRWAEEREERAYNAGYRDGWNEGWMAGDSHARDKFPRGSSSDATQQSVQKSSKKKPGWVTQWYKAIFISTVFWLQLLSQLVWQTLVLTDL